MNSEVVIVNALRTPIGLFQGSLAGCSAVQLGASVLPGLRQASAAQLPAIDEVLLGCVLPAGLGQAPARQAALQAGLPEQVPCTTLIKLCVQQAIPLVFLQNISGFMVGRKYEHEGIVKHGAKLVMAVACAEVPKFTIIIGNSFGAGNYAMCGRAYSPRFLWSWPNARIAVMGASIAASLLTDVKRGTNVATPGSASEAVVLALRQAVEQRYTEQALPYHATAQLWDDGIIDPVDTRKVLANALRLAGQTAVPATRYGIMRM